jgi:hypothetical protein
VVTTPLHRVSSYQSVLELELERLKRHEGRLARIPWPLAIDDRVALRRDRQIVEQLLSRAAA